MGHHQQNKQLRGVNLGGWLVLERWITPSLFKGSTAKDEFSLMQQPGAVEVVERHRREYITEADFKWLADNCVNAVRIPVGYWIFDGDGPFTACISYLDWAVKMAEKYSLKVLIDLHGARGSQNGKHHSGRIGEPDWYHNSAYRQETIEILKRLALRYKESPAVWGIELLNEPSLGPIKYFILLRFYRAAYQELTKVARPGLRIVFSDAFMPWLLTGALRLASNYPVIMDVHYYQFGQANLGRYFARLTRRALEIKFLQCRQPVIIGEWSGVISHFNLKNLSAQRRASLQAQHIERQLSAYQGAAGWFYWTYKTEGGGIWNFREQVERGRLLLE